MKEKILNRLITVKSIITITLTIVFAVLSLLGEIQPDAFQDIFYIIVAFYFGSQLEKTAQMTGTKTE